ncbi:MAG: hybrid sensor histidine kinase/response regulator [Deltaproteobacteria bacterium]|nr:hybrid sensor histidine kinase/response regulator [Candidatus Anaeroferrophillus wilburensis]MBN2888206.1 hybrid sensor histidine kinase/response regulator [Deltaproteobacteria bacterium]
MISSEKAARKLHVVLIEDSHTTAAAIVNKLVDVHGCRVSHFVNGKDFFSGFNLNVLPDIFLVDSILKDQQGRLLASGVDIVSRIKTIKRYLNVPVIMMSSAGDEQEPPFQAMVDSFYYQQKINGLMAGAADVIYKPHSADLESNPDMFPFDELVHKIRMLTQRRLLQQELKKSNRQLRQKNRELAMLNNNYINVLSFVSHELRNSLVVVGGFLRRLSRSIIGDAEQRDLDTIISNCEFMEDMIDRYLILSRIEMGRLRLNITDIDDFYQMIIAPVFKRLGRQNLEKRISYDGQLELAAVSFHADRYLLQVVFSNLFNNALKYGIPEGKISYGVTAYDDGLQFHVWNEGTGIADDKINKVFQKFQRLKDQNIPEQKGIGLGLYNVKEIVELHGGKIWVESEYGQWADFIFRLPRVVSESH